MNDGIGEQPTPTTEEPELYPGGVDAVIPEEPATLGHDLDPGSNAAVDEDVVPDEITEPDQGKEQAPDDGKVSGEDDTEDEPPA
ncbi:hypothetical protein [Nocardioides campestrisoli]|uniref:hypothetical protein n=1 Tax=Nocardioides campestrisoli TaxID=2736757 RepID=UPI0015E7DACB|nr:hypothetical protein [Nocardioides campestrisoli]